MTMLEQEVLYGRDSFFPTWYTGWVNWSGQLDGVLVGGQVVGSTGPKVQQVLEFNQSINQ